MIRSVVLFAVVAVFSVGCGKNGGGGGGGGGGGLSEKEACDLASDYVEFETIVTAGGANLTNVTAGNCRNFRSKASEGGAFIDVLATGDVTVGSRSEERNSWQTCVLVEYDQGWAAETCTP